MRELGYGAEYRYAHDAPDAQVEQEHLPDALRGRTYYRPVDRGVEAGIRERLARWREQRAGAGARAPRSRPPQERGPA
jgi:putative ATPase